MYARSKRGPVKMSKLSIAALIVLSLCRVARAQTPQLWQQTFKVGAGCALLVNNASGTIKVAGGAGDQIEAKALRRSSNADIAVRAVGNRVELRAERADRNRNNNTEVEFDVKVPSA